MQRLHHIALGTADVSRLTHFYCDVLELPERTRHYSDDGALRSVWLELGGGLLMIEHSLHVRPRVDGVGAGWFLIAFDVNEREQSALEQRLLAHGTAIEERTEWTSYARDPDGNRIAFSRYPLSPERA